MAIHARTPEGDEPRAIFSDHIIGADLDDGAIEGVVMNCGGYIDHEEDPEDMFFEGGFEDSLVWGALGRDCVRGHDWALVATGTAPQIHWLGKVAQVSRVDEDGIRPFAPMTVTGWLARLGTHGEPEFLVVLTSSKL